jgi:hypothetical protein
MLKHLKENNETFLSHYVFASTIGISLIARGLIFIMHAVFPVCDIPKTFNLEQTCKKLQVWNKYTQERNKNAS